MFDKLLNDRLNLRRVILSYTPARINIRDH
jgi:hypothetical protein